MNLENLREELVFRVSMYQLSEMERDALNHYPGIPPAGMVEALRGGIMVMQNILSDLWYKGIRVRIVPSGLKITDLPEFRHLQGNKTDDGRSWEGDEIPGFYCFQNKMVVLREDDIIQRDSVNQQFHYLVHEFAHAIWHVVLDGSERALVTHLFREERAQKPTSLENRLKDEFEMFADGFRYYVTPHRESCILRVAERWSQGQTVVVEETTGCVDTSRKDLRELNIKLYVFLDRKFRGIIDPELVMAKSYSVDSGEQFDYYEDSGIYRPSTYVDLTIGDPDFDLETVSTVDWSS